MTIVLDSDMSRQILGFLVYRLALYNKTER